MTSYLLNPVHDLAEGIHKIKCNYGHSNKKSEECGIKYYINYFIVYKCFNRNYQEKFDEDLKKRFANTYTFSNHDINKFILLLQEGDYPYEFVDDGEKFEETSLPEKKHFSISLNMERP